MTFAEKIAPREKEQDPETGRALAAMKALIANSNDGSAAPVLKDRWGFGSKAFKVQSGVSALAVLIVALVILASMSRDHAAKTAYKHVPPEEPVAAVVPQTEAVAATLPAPAFNEPMLPLPTTGRIRTLWKRDSGAARTILAPLRVVTATGRPNYYIELMDWETHAPMLVLFVRSGETASVKVPLGKYELRYAAGEKWYGEAYLFGPGTAYSRVDERFEFRIEDEKISGFTVELIKQRDGNLKETAIKGSDF